LDSNHKNKNSSTNTYQFGSLSYKEARTIIEKLRDVRLKLEYNEARLTEELALAKEDSYLLMQVAICKVIKQKTSIVEEVVILD
jgi:hypothetical protein